MTVLCPHQRLAYLTQGDALLASQAMHRFPVAHLCPTCEHWHAGSRHTRCPSRKVPHGCKEEAQLAADRLNAKPDGYGRSYPYECSTCGQWHVGRPHKGKTLQ